MNHDYNINDINIYFYLVYYLRIFTILSEKLIKYVFDLIINYKNNLYTRNTIFYFFYQINKREDKKTFIFY